MNGKEFLYKKIAGTEIFLLSNMIQRSPIQKIQKSLYGKKNL